MEGLEKLHQQLEKSTIDSLSLIVLSHILAPSPPSTHTHTRYACTRSILSPSQGMTVCFITLVIVPFMNQSSQTWTHQSAVTLLEEGSCPLCSRLLLCCYSGEVQLSERHQGAKNNMVKNLNNKLLGIQGCAASRLPLTFPKRIVQNLSIYSRPVQWGQNSRVVKYFGSRFFHSFPMVLLINIFAEASLPKEIAIIFM